MPTAAELRKKLDADRAARERREQEEKEAREQRLREEQEQEEAMLRELAEEEEREKEREEEEKRLREAEEKRVREAEEAEQREREAAMEAEKERERRAIIEKSVARATLWKGVVQPTIKVSAVPAGSSSESPKKKGKKKVLGPCWNCTSAEIECERPE
jgi:hypothetical protein